MAKFNPRRLQQVHPIHWVALGAAISAFVANALYPISLYYPNGHSSLFATTHYVVPLLVALFVALAVGAKSRTSHQWGDLVGNALALTLSFSLIVFLHFNFKLWAPLINPTLWDEFYRLTDQHAETVIEAIALIHGMVAPLPMYWPGAYHDLFIGMFLTSLVLHASHAKTTDTLTELATAIALVLVIGGMAYSLAPAWGPFIYGPGTNPLATEIQRHMLDLELAFVSSGGQAYEGGSFVAGLAAMPSLHTAHAYLFLHYAWRHVRWLGYVYLPVFIFILTEAVMARWHYLLDIPAGMLVAFVSLLLSRQLVTQYRKPTKNQAGIT